MGGAVAVGTSGWSYDHWSGRFYPEDLPRSRWFDHYLERFPTVEVNYTFYRLPSERTVERWRTQAPPRFRFAVKGSRFITHVRRLSDVQDPVDRFQARVDGLESFLGPILWQLPPNLPRDVELLKGFLGTLSSGRRHAMEFRHPSWLDPAVSELLEEHDVAQVAVSSRSMPEDRKVTAGIVYVRFHGLEGGYEHDYRDQELAPWVEFLRRAADSGRDGYAFFNNDGLGRAPRNAARLIELLGDTAVPWP